MPGIPVLLRTTPRDVRAARGAAQGMRLSSHARAAAFAQAITDRFTVRALPWLPQSLTFKQDRPGVAVQYLQQHSHTHVAPRLALTVLAWPAAQPGSAAHEPARPASRLRVEQEIRTLRTVIRLSESSAPEQLVHRVLAQSRRVEGMPPAAHLQASRSLLREPASAEAAELETPMVQPVPRIVRRLAPVEADQVASMRPAEGSRPVRGEGLRATGTSPRPPEQVIDVNRLTDQVIQAIDRRIIAQRERLGRA